MNYLIVFAFLFATQAYSQAPLIRSNFAIDQDSCVEVNIGGTQTQSLCVDGPTGFIGINRDAPSTILDILPKDGAAFRESGIKIQRQTVPTQNGYINMDTGSLNLSTDSTGNVRIGVNSGDVFTHHVSVSNAGATTLGNPGTVATHTVNGSLDVTNPTAAAFRLKLSSGAFDGLNLLLNQNHSGNGKTWALKTRLNGSTSEFRIASSAAVNGNNDGDTGYTTWLKIATTGLSTFEGNLVLNRPAATKTVMAMKQNNVEKSSISLSAFTNDTMLGSLLGDTMIRTENQKILMGTNSASNPSLVLPAGGGSVQIWSAVAGSDAMCASGGSGGLRTIGDCSSSIKYKDDVKTLTDEESDKIYQLNPVSFNWNEKSHNEGREDYGLIAEEVDLVLPKLANRDAEGELSGVKYRHFTALLLKEMQDHEKEIKELRDEIKALKDSL